MFIASVRASPRPSLISTQSQKLRPEMTSLSAPRALQYLWGEGKAALPSPPSGGGPASLVGIASEAVGRASSGAATLPEVAAPRFLDLLIFFFRLLPCLLTCLGLAAEAAPALSARS